MMNITTTEAIVTIAEIRLCLESIITRDMAPGPASNGVAKGTMPRSGFLNVFPVDLGRSPSLTMTSDYSVSEQKVAAKDAFVYGTIILVFFSITGNIILSLMGISLSAIQIAGGIILLIMGIEMVREGDRPKSTGKTFKNPDLGIVPFATPLLSWACLR